jgi:hypothetical protein
VLFPGASNVAAINLSAEFFAPETFTVPERRAPPTTLKRSSVIQVIVIAQPQMLD